MSETAYDLGHDLLFGSFLTPAARSAADVVALAQLSEQAGLDLVTFQDHPYQSAFLDSWTLLSYVAASTSRVGLALNVANLPLRPPVVLARSAATLDLLSGGRVELGLGAGAFWDAIEAAGGTRLTAAQAVDALAEAIAIVRAVWDTKARGGIRVEGRHHRAMGAKRGPQPAHDIGIWVGAYKQRMLRLTGAVADGWLPSLSYLPGGPSDLTALNAVIDGAAEAAGRAPADVRRLLNISGRFADRSTALLDGPPAQWIEELADMALHYGISAFILGSDDPDAIAAFGQEVAPGVRELVEAERSAPSGAERSADQPATVAAEPAGASAVSGGLRVLPTPAPTIHWSQEQPWDESARPDAPPAPSRVVYSERAQAVGQHLVDVHDHLRRELEQLRDVLRQVQQGVSTAARARAALNDMALRQNNWTLGAFCASYCRLVSEHHHIEDSAVFPHLRRADPALTPVLDRLESEHVVIHGVVDGVDRALVAFIKNPSDFSPVQGAVDLLTDALLSHLAYEERQIVEPLARLGFYPGQL